VAVLTIGQPLEWVTRRRRWKQWDRQKRIMSEKQQTDRVRMSQVLAGALAAVTAALLGSTMGVAGTVVGAALASVVSTVGGALYLRSIQRTTEGVRTVTAKVVGRSGGATVLVSDDPAPTTGEEVAVTAREGSTTEDVPDQPQVDADEDRPPVQRRRLRWPMIVVGSLAAFVLGMLAVTGVEWLRGESLSGETGTTFGSIVDPHHGGGQEQRPVDQQGDPSAPPTTTTTTPPADPTGPTSTTTTTTSPPSSGSSTTTTTSEPPVTTTTSPPVGTVPPSN
jgi:hypothetical protein